MNLNFWDKYDDWITRQANTNYTWSGPDCKETYENKPSGFVTYKDKDFTYKRNSFGFRSDEFNNDDPVKILYAGCSYTEGVGLPLEHTWSGFLNDSISTEIGKKINHYNIGIGGFSIDAIIRYIYITVKFGIFKPDVIFILLPSPARNEYLIQDKYAGYAFYHFIPTFTDYSDPAKKVLHANVLKTISFEQRLHETFRNLLFLDLFLKSHNIPWYFSTWDKHAPAQFNRWVPNMYDLGPQEVRKQYIDSIFVFDDFVKKSTNPVPFGFEQKFEQNIGRDYLHPGPNSHWNFTRTFYKNLQQKEDFKELIQKWKS